MNGSKIDATEWLNSELFINNTLPFLFIIIGFCFFGVILLGLYANKSRFRTIALISFTVCGLIIGSYSYLKIQTLKGFNEIASNQSSAIRDRQKKPFIYEYSKKRHGDQLDVLKLDNLHFYDKEVVIDDESVTFLGKTEHIYYIKIYNNLYNLNLSSPNIEFKEDYDKAVRTGFSYKLNDKAFSEIGFYPEIGPVYTKIIVPLKLKDMEYVDLDERSKTLEF